MRIIFVLSLTLLLFSCARDNPRIFGGINVDIKDENQIALSYEPEFEMGDILKDAYKMAKVHCKKFGKKAIFISKQESFLSGYTTINFECK